MLKNKKGYILSKSENKLFVPDLRALLKGKKTAFLQNFKRDIV